MAPNAQALLLIWPQAMRRGAWKASVSLPVEYNRPRHAWENSCDGRASYRLAMLARYPSARWWKLVAFTVQALRRTPGKANAIQADQVAQRDAVLYLQPTSSGINAA